MRINMGSNSQGYFSGLSITPPNLCANSYTWPLCKWQKCLSVTHNGNDATRQSFFRFSFILRQRYHSCAVFNFFLINSIDSRACQKSVFQLLQKRRAFKKISLHHTIFRFKYFSNEKQEPFFSQSSHVQAWFTSECHL